MNSLNLKRDQDKISPFGNEMVNDFSFFTVTVTSEFVFGERIDCGGQLFKWVWEGIVKLGQLSSSRESCDYTQELCLFFLQVPELSADQLSAATTTKKKRLNRR